MSEWTTERNAEFRRLVTELLTARPDAWRDPNWIAEIAAGLEVRSRSAVILLGPTHPAGDEGA